MTKAEQDIISILARLDAIEQYQKIQKYCAATAVTLTEAQARMIQLHRKNVRTFGSATDANYGYGAMFSRLRRFNKAEELYDRYHFNKFHIDNIKETIFYVSATCQALLAFPSPNDLDRNSVFGVVEFEGQVQKFNLISRQDMLRTTSLVLDGSTTADSDQSTFANIVDMYSDMLQQGQKWTYYISNASSLSDDELKESLLSSGHEGSCTRKNSSGRYSAHCQ